MHDASSKAGPILAWLKDEHDLGRGHGMAMVHVITKGAIISGTHVGTEVRTATIRTPCTWTARPGAGNELPPGTTPRAGTTQAAPARQHARTRATTR